ncbi:hypothetical protein HI914_00930 [Erysiphe necator]|nr:hypothetical protein HI914_00930 [Erysiphe necator]
MAALVQSGQYLCMSCQVVKSSPELCNVHFSVCPYPNIHCIALVPTPPAAGDAGKDKPGEKPSGNKSKDDDTDGLVRIYGNKQVVINNHYRPRS